MSYPSQRDRAFCEKWAPRFSMSTQYVDCGTYGYTAVTDLRPTVVASTDKMREQDFNEHPFILTVERMLATLPKMTDGEKQALAEWEKANLGSGEKGTTDWPGWTDVYARLSH